MSTEQNSKKHVNVGMAGHIPGHHSLLAAKLVAASLGIVDPRVPFVSRDHTFDIAAPQSKKHGPEWYQRLGEKYAEEMKEKARLKMERKKARKA